MAYKYLFRLILSLFFMIHIGDSKVYSQDEDDSTFIFNGLIWDVYSGEPLIYSHIINLNFNKAVLSDRKGRFKIKARNNDTLYVSNVGYQNRLYSIEEGSDSTALYSIKMVPDTFMLAAFNVFGPTPLAQFKNNFINLQLPKDTLNPAFEQFIAEDDHFNTLETAFIIPGPVTMIYNHFNRHARLKRRLESNREEYYNNLPEEEKRKVIFYNDDEVLEDDK